MSEEFYFNYFSFYDNDFSVKLVWVCCKKGYFAIDSSDGLQLCQEIFVDDDEPHFKYDFFEIMERGKILLAKDGEQYGTLSASPQRLCIFTPFEKNKTAEIDHKITQLLREHSLIFS
jgi:hypothetical protein